MFVYVWLSATTFEEPSTIHKHIDIQKNINDLILVESIHLMKRRLLDDKQSVRLVITKIVI